MQRHDSLTKSEGWYWFAVSQGEFSWIPPWSAELSMNQQLLFKDQQSDPKIKSHTISVWLSKTTCICRLTTAFPVGIRLNFERSASSYCQFLSIQVLTWGSPNTVLADARVVVRLPCIELFTLPVTPALNSSIWWIQLFHLRTGQINNAEYNQNWTDDRPKIGELMKNQQPNHRSPD